MKTAVRFTLSSIIGLVVLGFILFYPAGTFNYWQAWVFIAVFTAGTIFPSLYLARTDPAALQRRSSTIVATPAIERASNPLKQ